MKAKKYTFEDVMDQSPYSQEFSFHLQEIDFDCSNINSVIAEVAYCISKYTEPGWVNYEILNEDYSWMPEDAGYRIDYEENQKLLKKELAELKALHKYLIRMKPHMVDA